MFKCAFALRHATRQGMSSRQLRYISSQHESEADYVIVGAGSAGCVLANRLSAESGNSVHVLEAGGEDKWWNWKFHMPAALMYTLKDPKYNWCYYTKPQKHVDNRELYWPRAKVWGGCSNHNAMVYIRGNAMDYNRWESLGATGWSYADVLPYFKKSETYERGEDDYRGGSGPTHISRGKQENNPLFKAFVDAGVQAGYPYTDDVNGYQQEGFGSYDYTIWKGKRSSASVSYLKPALKRSNLSITSHVLVTRLLVEGKKAVGVEYQLGGKTKKIRARKEVIVSAGAINSPQLLMLSGIGPADHLREMDIDVKHHLPGVGQSLQDHLEVYVQHKCKKPITLFKYQWKYPHYMISAGLRWFYNQTGPASTTHLDVGAFIRSAEGVPCPDIQYHFLPSVVIDHGQKTGTCHAFQVHAGTERSTSVGEVRLTSKNPAQYVTMDPNYLSSEEDRNDFRKCIRHAREVFAQQAFDEFRGEELLPGPDCQSDKQIDAFVRAHGDSAYHPSCTCKIGPESDPLAVVDAECRVYGMESLRVVDASIMPAVTTGNLNGPVLMMAEKAADIILGNPPLPKSTAPFYSPSTLDTQR